MHWTDNMMIPMNARNPLSAMAWMNYYYQPRVAAMVADWVEYITPVPDAQAILDEVRPFRRPQLARVPDARDVRPGTQLPDVLDPGPVRRLERELRSDHQLLTRRIRSYGETGASRLR